MFPSDSGLLTIFITGWIIWIFALGVFFLAGSLVKIVPGAFDSIANNGSIFNPQTRDTNEYKVPNYPYIIQYVILYDLST